MSTLTPIQSVSSYLNQKLDDVTTLSTKKSHVNTLKITARVIGRAALLVAGTIETAIRYLIALGGFAISFALKDEMKENFKNDYVNPAFEHASMNKDAFFAIKDGLIQDYQTHIKPFLNNKVQAPIN